MTDNIQKLYEITEVKRIYSEFNNGKETVVENVFSPYRQLELIKWIAFHKNGLSILSVTDDRNEFVMESDYVWGNYHKRTKKIKDFSQALVSLIIQLWNDLTDAQKAEIKRILE